MDLLPVTPKQETCLRLARSREARLNVWEGAVRSGKTINSLIAWADFVGNGPDGPLLMAGRTIDTLRRNVVEPLIDLLGSQYVQASYGGGRTRIAGRPVHLIGADNQAAETRIRGLTLAGAYVDELTIIGGNHGQAWFNMLLTRLSVEGAKLFATTNPGHPSHWLLTEYLNKADVTITPGGTIERRRVPQGLGVFRYRFTLDDNTALPADYVASLKASLTGVFYDRFIRGEWVAAEGAVFPGFVAEMTELPGKFTDYTLGIDVGTTNPTHAVLCGVAGGEVWVLGEHVITDNTLTYSTQVARIWDWLQSETGGVKVTVVVDPSARAFRNEWRQKAGEWTWAADNSVLQGISDIGVLFTHNALHITDAHTPKLVGELQGYRWDPKATEHGEDKPLKQDDHGVDALRYAIRALAKVWRPTVTPTPATPEVFVPRWKQPH